MKVYGILDQRLDSGGKLRQQRRVVATTSQKKAAEAFGVSLYVLRTFGGQTGNEQEVALAMACPGKPVWVES